MADQTSLVQHQWLLRLLWDQKKGTLCCTDKASKAHSVMLLVCRQQSKASGSSVDQMVGVLLQHDSSQLARQHKTNTELCANLTCKYVSAITDTHHIVMWCGPVWEGENKCWVFCENLFFSPLCDFSFRDICERVSSCFLCDFLTSCV